MLPIADAFRPMRSGLIAAALGLTMLAPQPCDAAARALLVGVSGYRDAPLAGPPNDVALMHGVLVARGIAPADITVLADRLPDSAPLKAKAMPTLAAIRAELEKLAATAAAGDFIYIHMSGHGSQQPAAPGDPLEPDGKDEIFLPIDVGQWQQNAGTVENALVDNEVAGFVERMRERGAFVWIVFDACHSATATRLAGEPADDVRTRRIDPHRLGVPEMPAAQPVRGGDNVPLSVGHSDFAAQAGRGGLVAFFAAQPEQPTYEMLFPRDIMADNRRSQGALTFALAQALTRNPAASYRELAQAILFGYDRAQRAMPTPSFEGDLDRAAFGSDGGRETVLPATRRRDGLFELAAGHLHGLTPGTTVAVRGIDDAPGTVRATTRIDSVGFSTSLLSKFEAAGADLPERLLVTIETDMLALELRVAAPFAADGDMAALEAARTALARLQEGRAAGPRLALRLGTPDDQADVHLRIEGGRIWLLNGLGQWQPAPASGPDRRQYLAVDARRAADEVVRDLGEALATVARARNLLAVASGLGGGAPPTLRVRTLILPGPAASPAAAGPPDNRPCPATPVDRLPAAALAFALIDTPVVRHCDTIYLSLANTGPHPLDVTLLHVDERGCISFLRAIKDEPRFLPGQPERIVAIPYETWNRARGTPGTTGLERFVLLAVERRSQDEIAYSLTFNHLARACGQSRSPATRAGGARPRAGLDQALDGLMEQALGDEPVRSGQAPRGLSEHAGAVILRLDVRPPE